MARVQSQQIINALEKMRGLNGQTDSLLDIIQAQQVNNMEAIRQMEGAANLIKTFMQGRQDMEDILNAVGRHDEDMNQNIERIKEALQQQPSVDEMGKAIKNLEETRSMALQSGLPYVPPPGQPPAQPNSGSPGAFAGGYNWRTSSKSSSKKSKGKRTSKRGGYNWRSTEKKTKTRKKMKTKRPRSSSSSRRSRRRK